MAPPEVILMGTFTGAIYGLIGIGLSLIFTGIRNMINLAHGHLAVLAAYLALTLSSNSMLDPLICALLVVPIVFALGAIIQYGAVNRLIYRSPTIPLILFAGIASIIENVALLVWHPDPRSLAPLAPYSLLTVSLLGVRLPLIYLVGFLISLGSMLILYTFLKHTDIGRAIRAASEDPEYAECLGVDTKKIYAYTFGIGGALAAIAGIMVGLIYLFVPSDGWPYTILSFGVIVLGGVGSMRGAFVGGVILGISQQLSAYYLGVAYQYFVGYILILAVLALRPQGIFGMRV
ncbi:MAG: branched-chain amino acid ABC transporter permease [Candidatus Nezhaarchaeales archaeon]|nr:MAG: hypothetical protein DSO06_00300 [Candidatus Nezhaarchaeota archaeon WYZ-LMO8]